MQHQGPAGLHLGDRKREAFLHAQPARRDEANLVTRRQVLPLVADSRVL